MITTPIIHDRHIVKSCFEHMQLHEYNRNKFSLPSDLTIISCRNEGTMSDRIIDTLQGYETKSILECSLEYLGIDNLVVLTDNRLPWRNTFKIEMIHDYLQHCKTDYILYCDAIDVIFVDSPLRVLDLFKDFNCEMVFMSSTSTDGYDCMPDVYAWTKTHHANRFLNSGVWIGKTNFVREVFAEAIRYITPHGVTMDNYRDYLKSMPSNYPIGAQDQDIFRYLEPKFYPKILVDYKNLIAYRS